MDFILAALIDFFVIEPIIASHIGFFVYFFNSKRFIRMSANECLSRLLSNQEDAVITIGTIQNGKTHWTVYGENGKTLPNYQHRYEIASITKTMTGTIVAKAEHDGLLNIDDTIDKYLKLDQNYTYPTIRDLLTHTSGYKSVYIEKEVFKTIQNTRNILSGVNSEMALRRIEKLGNKKLERQWKYSNFNFAVLGLILESVYHKPYEEIVTEFLATNGLENSYISDGKGDLNNYLGWQKGDVYMAGGAVSSNIEDMLKYAQLQLSHREEFDRAHITLKEVQMRPELSAQRHAMCYGWMKDQQNDFFWHNGQTPGYRTYIGVCPESETAVVILSNVQRCFNIHHMESNIGAKILENLQKETVRC